MTFSLLLTLLAVTPAPPTGAELGSLPEALRVMADPEGLWVGRVGVGLSPTGLWLDGQALPRAVGAGGGSHYPGLVSVLEERARAGQAAAGADRFIGELYVELDPETSFSELLLVLGAAEQAGFAQARVALRGDPLPRPFSTRVGLRPMGGRQVFRLEGGQWVEDAACSMKGTPNERLLAVDGAAPASTWLEAVQQEQGLFRLALVDPASCAS